uniref:RING-type E3 ubiquitin transferase n=1 Tax=Drosophila melanogaster TaxID=7227 RepID=A1A749_DROME
MPQIMNSKDKRNPNYSGGNSGEEEDSWMNSYYTCLVCMQTAESPRVSFCGHHFCSQCIYNWIRSQKYQAKCPYCQSLIGENTLITITMRRRRTYFRANPLWSTAARCA